MGFKGLGLWGLGSKAFPWHAAKKSAKSSTGQYTGLLL